MSKIGRNDPCPCGSGKKYKNCCGKKENRRSFTDTLFSDAKYLNMFEEEYRKVLETDERNARQLEKISRDLDAFITGNSKGLLVDTGRFINYAANEYLEDVNALPSHFSNSSLIADEEFINHEYNRHGGMYSVMLLYLLCGHIAFSLNEIDKGTVKSSEKKKYNINIAYYRAKKELLVDFLNGIDRFSEKMKEVIDKRELKHLDDDIDEVDSEAIEGKFVKAVQTGQKSMAFKLLGEMKNPTQEKKNYYTAMAHFINCEYDETIRYADRLTPDDSRYLSAVYMKLECFAILGQLENFFECVRKSSPVSIDLWHLRLLLITLFMNITEEPFEARDGYELGALHDEVERVLDNCAFEIAEDNYHKNKVYRLASKMVVEGLTLIEQLAEIPDDVSKSSSAQKAKLKLLEKVNRIKVTLKWFMPIAEFSEVLDVSAADDSHKLAERKSQAIKLIQRELVDNEIDGWFLDAKVAAEATVKLGDSVGYIRIINTNCDAIIKDARNGNKDAEELLRVGYIESIVSEEEIIDERVVNYLSEIRGRNNLKNDITDRMILRFLSPQGKLAYEAAEWQFQKSQEEDYGWRDAGLISFGYYRILELEMNLKLAIPLFMSTGSADDLKKINDGKNPDAKKKSKFKSNWNKNVEKYCKLEKSGFKSEKFMLGELKHLFRLTGSSYNEEDMVATRLIESLPTVLTEYGLEKYKDGFFEQLTGDETRNKFRNPPAHTQYLSYDIACECREIFRNTILEFTQMFK